MMVVVVFLVGIAAVVGLAAFILWYSTRLVGRFAGGKHEGADDILATGCVPVSWLVDFDHGPPRVRRRMNKRKAVARLRSILKYYRTTPLVPDEETRRRTISSLKAVLARWKAAPWSEMLPPNMPL